MAHGILDQRAHALRLLYQRALKVRDANETAIEPSTNSGLNLLGSRPRTRGIDDRSGQ
jgi:hypothetical protein